MLSCACILSFTSPTRAEPESDTEALETEVQQPTESGRDRLGSVALDPLGFALFGPSLNAEVGLKQFAVGAGFRWFSPGLLANELFLEGGDAFAFSYGIALRGQYYFLDPLAGPHAGLSVEYLKTRVENDGAGIASVSSYVVPQVEGGYRHAMGTFFVGGVLTVGYAKQASGRIENLPGEDNADAFFVRDESSVYGSARLDLGVYF